MDPVALVDWLTKLGPYAVAGLLAVWLVLERKERITAQADARELRDKRAEELKDGAEALAELGEAMRTALRELSQMLVQRTGGP